MIGERPNKKNIETLNLTQEVNLLRLRCGKYKVGASTTNTIGGGGGEKQFNPEKVKNVAQLKK